METLQELLEKVVRLEKADKGSIQIFDSAVGGLKFVAQVGFEESFLKHFAIVKPFDSSTYGRAYGIGSTVIINDVQADIGFKAYRDAALTAGYRSVKSVPIFGKNEKCIGVISTHFKEPKWQWEMHQLVNFLPDLASALEALQAKMYMIKQSK